MDPATLSALINGGSKVLSSALDASKPAPPPPQRADGYSLGGALESASPNSSSSGAVGGAYGGAFSQATLDGSNWTVSTGKGTATGGGKSGGNGGLSPLQNFTQGGITPQTPFSFESPFGNLNGGNQSTMMIIALAVVAYLIVKR